MNGEKLEELAGFFKCLSNETRLYIIALLTERPLCVCEIMGALGITQTKASRHLIYLKNTGILSSSREDRWMVYRVREDLSREKKTILSMVASMVRSSPSFAPVKRKLEEIIADSSYRAKYGIQSHEA